MKWDQELITRGQAIVDAIDFTNVTPQKHDVLRFLEMDPAHIKIVIIGQDPYPTLGVANGRAFAVNKGCPLPQSLRNLFKEIAQVQGQVFTDETLELWAQQGVLLLNTALTTIVGQPNAHQHLWQKYTHDVIAWLDANFAITWVLWGNAAIKLGQNLRGYKICDAHPSPLSVRRRRNNTFEQLSQIKW